MTPSPEFKTLEDEVKHLRAMNKKLEANKVKLLDSLRLKEQKDSENYVYLPASELSHFFTRSKCDQKLLAILYWDKLTDKQKEVFTDKQEVELAKEYNRRQMERMSDPVKMRQYFLESASPVLDTMLSMANGNDRTNSSIEYAMKEVWEVLKGVINSASNPAPMLDLHGKTISDQIDVILSNVSQGKITFDEAKDYMSLVSSGFNLQELPKLMQKLDALENMS